MSDWTICHPLKLSSKRPGSSPPDPPATGIRTAASSAHDCICRWRRSATPCSHSSKTGTPTRAELPNNPCRPSATSSAEYQQSPRARLSSRGLPSRARRGEQFRRTRSERRETQQDDQLVWFAVDANYRHKYVAAGRNHCRTPASTHAAAFAAPRGCGSRVSRLASRLRACQRAGLTCILSLASHHDAVDVDSEGLQAGRWMARSCLIC